MRRQAANARFPRSFHSLYALVLLAAAARLALQILAMPAYAGMDEIFHVARFSFVFEEGHNPGVNEPSIAPRYIASIDGNPGFPPDFAFRGKEWGQRVHEAPFADPIALSGTVGADSRTNYEAQQASFAYSLLAPLEGFLAPRTMLSELMLLRWAACAFALLAVAATAALAARQFGRMGLLAAALLCAVPTWIALVARAGNDAVACGLLSLAIAIGFSRRITHGRTLVAGLVWSAAFLTKLTAWPAAALLGVQSLLRRDLWGRRSAILLAFLGAAALVTIHDLGQRTGIAIGSQSFSSPKDAAPVPVPASAAFDLAASLRILVASFVWPGAQHGNALRPLGMLLFAGPLAVIACLGLAGARRSARLRRWHLLAGCTLLAFAAAQGANAYGFVARARFAGRALSDGGFEGWYVWTLGIVLVGILLAAAFRALRSRPLLVALFAVWLLGWDVAIHEGALFRDYAGLTTADPPGLIFRWTGPGSLSDMLEQLSRVSASQAPPWLFVVLRLVHLTATLGLLAAICGRRPLVARLRRGGRRRDSAPGDVPALSAAVAGAAGDFGPRPLPGHLGLGEA